MLVEDRRTDGFDAILHQKIVTVVGQCVRRGIVVQSRHNRADAAAVPAPSLGAYLIESNLRGMRMRLRAPDLRLSTFLDMKALEIDRLFSQRPTPPR